MKLKLEMAANNLRLENRLASTERSPLMVSRGQAGFSPHSTSFSVQLMNLQNALSRVNRTDH